MDIIGTDTQDNRCRVHLRVKHDEGDELVAYGLPRHLEKLPADAEALIRRALADHDLAQYPEGAALGSIAPYDDVPDPLGSRAIRDPEAVRTDPYPHSVPLTEFPPDEGQRCGW